MIQTDTIEILTTKNSKFSQVDFNNLSFGKVFSDHCFVMEYTDGNWQKPCIKPFENISLSPATSVLHYGQSIFEGLKAFLGKDGKVRIFRPQANASRFNRSATRMCMPTIPEDLFVLAVKSLVAVDKKWVPETPGSSLYIRPFMFATDEFIGVRPSNNYSFIIFTGPVGGYYAQPVKVKIETDYSRAVKGGVGAAKTAGNYAASLYPAKIAQQQGFDQLIWTDSQTHQYIEESGTMNIMFRIDDKLITPESSDTILEGITRISVVELAKKWGYTVEQRKVMVSEVIEALENNSLKEAFGLGTAATIAPIATIHFKGKDYPLSTHTNWEFANKASQYMSSLKRGEEFDQMNWIEIVE